MFVEGVGEGRGKRTNGQCKREKQGDGRIRRKKEMKGKRRHDEKEKGGKGGRKWGRRRKK